MEFAKIRYDGSQFNIVDKYYFAGSDPQEEDFIKLNSVGIYDDTGNVLYEGDAIYKYIGYDEMICSSSTRYYEDIVDRIREEDGVDLYEELAKLDNFTDIRFSKEALR
ncbi:hypothetical protein QYZ88_008090 [Lachnospiraceae bacterium C1.1]|nr:hypothetical protein [Lachnospiraceae bacterium C1.1]